jgi:hypothetical protein
MLPHVPWLRTSSFCRGGLQRYHVPHGSEPHLSAKNGSDAAMRSTIFCGLWSLSIKKDLTDLAM